MELVISGHEARMDVAVATLHETRSRILDRRRWSSFEPGDTSETAIALQSAALLVDEQDWRSHAALETTYSGLASSMRLMEVYGALMESPHVQAAVILRDLPRFEKKYLSTAAASNSLIEVKRVRGEAR